VVVGTGIVVVGTCIMLVCMLTMIPFPEGRFGALLVDPPWPFRSYSMKGRSRSVDRFYDEMAIADIMELPVSDLAADDSALFLWITSVHIPRALDVIAAWGFTYKTVAFVWVKPAKNPKLNGEPVMGGGYWTRANAELCLLATRGRPKRLSRAVRQVILAPRGRHSAKPPEVRTRIEQLVGGPRIELFARERVPGWTAWGDQL
jgi:N6-adenosine-specific RNA methylase IME4